MVFRLVLRLTFLLLPGAGAAQAADYFVAPHGNDAHSGARDQPWASLAKANEELRPGDTAFLRGGVCPGQQIKPRQTGTAEQPIRYTTYEKEQAVLTATKLAIDLTDRSRVARGPICIRRRGRSRCVQEQHRI
ncbi:MAG: hypothetical protein ACREIA_15610 [Opitutaceae bacterium]